LKKEILSDDFKKRKIFWKNIAENFPPHITSKNYFCKSCSDTALFILEHNESAVSISLWANKHGLSGVKHAASRSRYLAGIGRYLVL
jgi:hypothetical protein